MSRIGTLWAFCARTLHNSALFLILFVFLHAPLAFAEQEASLNSSNVPVPSYFTIEPNLPNQGYLDSYHHIEDDLSDVEKSAYMMRQLITIDLLKARGAILELTDQSFFSRFKEVSHLVPEEVSKTFLYDHEILPIRFLVDSINQNQLENKTDLKKKMISGLTRFSAFLTFIDHSLLYFDKHFFENHEEIRELVKKKNRELTIEANKNNMSYLGFKYYHDEHISGKKAVKKEFLESSGMQETMTYLMAIKQQILTKYPMLSILIEGRPFYAHIYAGLRTLGFPHPDNMDDPNQTSLDGRISFPKTFMSDFQDRWEVFAKGNWRGLLLRKMQDIFEIAVFELLDSNTKALQDLNSTIEYKDNKAPFLILMTNEKLWQRLRDNFTFFDESIIEKGANDLKEYLEIEKHQKKIRSIILGGFALALTFAGIGFFVVGGTSVMFVGGLFGLAATFQMTELTLDYLDKKRVAEVSKYLFEGSSELNDTESNESNELLEKEALSSLILGAAMSFLFVRGPVNNLLSKVPKFMMEKGNKFVRVNKYRLSMMKKRWALAFGPEKWAMIKNPLIAIAAGQQKLAKTNVMRGLSQKLTQVGVSSSRYVEWVKAMPGFEAVYNKIHKNAILMRDITIELTALYYAEKAIRGDKFDDEVLWVLGNALFSVGVMTAVVTRGTSDKTRLIWPALFKGNVREAGRNYLHAGSQLAMTIFGVSGVVFAGIETMMYFEDQKRYNRCMEKFNSTFCDQRTFSEHLERYALNVLFAGVFIGASATPRSEFVYKHANNFLNKKFKEAFIHNGKLLAETVKIPLSYLNNTFGVMIRVYVLRELGLQGGDDPKLWITVEDNVNNAHYLYKELLAMEEGAEGFSFPFNESTEESTLM